MSKSLEWTEVLITAGETPKRVDVFLAHREPTLSRAALQRLIQEGNVRINGQRVRRSQKIRPGDRISLLVPRVEPLEILPEAIPFEVLFEDDAVLVLNKPVGLVVHPAPGHWSGTLVNALLHHFKTAQGSLSTIGGKERPGLVHRLDKETSGVLVVAKSDQAHRALAAQFKQHTITRTYEALVWGRVKKSTGVIELAIGRDMRERKKFSAHTARGRASTTQYRVRERFRIGATLVEVTPRTGRTHQIRVHMAAIGHPILGDPTYGGRRVRQFEGLVVPRVMLHARMLGFSHPETGRAMEFSAPRPDDMDCLCEALRTASAIRKDA